MKNVMLDFETLDTVATAAIISIGAVQFELDGAIDTDGFYASVSIDSNIELGRTISESTLMWWMQQEEAARKVFTEPKVPMYVALQDFVDWFPKDEDVCLWSNGASFDIPMAEHVFRQVGMEIPWKFWNARCVRTYSKLPGAHTLSRPVNGVAHNALHDAVNQALHIQQIHAKLFLGIKEPA